MPVNLRRLDLRRVSGDVRSHLPRPEAAGAGSVETVKDILAQVRSGGDEAVRSLTRCFDDVRIDALGVESALLDAALAGIPEQLREALVAARSAIRSYHEGQLRPDDRSERDGIVVQDVRRPVQRAGLYVPGGRARYPSTVLMTAVPARVAGVPELVLCVPPDRDGTVNAPTLAAAALAGVDEVYRIGGAQAIGAMAYGTETIRPVDVIVGPGNTFVSLAKRQVAQEGLVATTAAFAGPSEVVVVADDTAPVDAAAIDVIVQAEHGPDGLAWLVTWSLAAAQQITSAIDRLVSEAPRRADIEATLTKNGYCVVVRDPQQAMAVANAVAPEHLELMTADPGALVPLVRNAGAVFCGAYAPASVGDYLAGPSHVLPTDRSARFASGLRVDDFSKQIHVVSLDQATLAKVGPHVVAIAEAEGLAAHAQSVRLRELL